MFEKVKIDKEFYGKLSSIAFPIIVQHFMLASVAVADALMLGNVEQNQMAAVSLATQIQFIQNMIIAAVVSGASVLCAQYYGKNDKKTVNDVFCIGLRLCGLASIVTFIGCMFFPRFLMTIFTNEEVLIEIGISYLRIAGWSYLLTGISQCYLTLMKVCDHAAMAAKISSLAVIINIVLNAVFIFGLFGLPQMEVKGAAYATLVARVIELICCITISFGKDYIRPDITRLFYRNKLLFSDFARCSLPLLGACLLWGVGFTSYTAFMGHLGVDAAAANSVCAVVRDLVVCACDGIANGGGILVGMELGKGDLEKGRKYGDKLVIISFIVGFISTAIMILLAPVVLDFVKLTDGARHLLYGMMIVMSVYMIGRTANTVIINGIFAAGGDTMFDMYSLVVTMWCLAVPLAALGTFVFAWSPVVVYACTCLDEVGKIPWVMLHYKKYKWVKDLTRDFS